MCEHVVKYIGRLNEMWMMTWLILPRHCLRGKSLTLYNYKTQRLGSVKTLSVCVCVFFLFLFLFFIFFVDLSSLFIILFLGSLKVLILSFPLELSQVSNLSSRSSISVSRFYQVHSRCPVSLSSS